MNALVLTDEPGRLAARPLDDWNAAYSKVESYFHALRVRNRLLMGHLVEQVLQRAMARAAQEPNRSATELAMEEMDSLVNQWFAQVLQEKAEGAEMLSTRGRLALLLADQAGRWQDQFLRPGPWPPEFIAPAMRETYLRAGPDFQISQMAPRPLDLGPLGAITQISRLPYARMVATWVLFRLFAGVVVCVHPLNPWLPPGPRPVSVRPPLLTHRGWRVFFSFPPPSC